MAENDVFKLDMTGDAIKLALHDLLNTILLTEDKVLELILEKFSILFEQQFDTYFSQKEDIIKTLALSVCAPKIENTEEQEEDLLDNSPEESYQEDIDNETEHTE